MVVEFTEDFMKQLKKSFDKKHAREILRKLHETRPTQGDLITKIDTILIKERKLKTHRFYFVQQFRRIQILTKEEIKEHLLQFIALSKKNNQQKIIDKVKKDIKKGIFN